MVRSDDQSLREHEIMRTDDMELFIIMYFGFSNEFGTFQISWCVLDDL